MIKGSEGFKVYSFGIAPITTPEEDLKQLLKQQRLAGDIKESASHRRRGSEVQIFAYSVFGVEISRPENDLNVFKCCHFVPYLKMIKTLHYIPVVLVKSLFIPGLDTVQNLCIFCCADFVLFLIAPPHIRELVGICHKLQHL